MLSSDSGVRQKHSNKFKALVGFEASKETMTVNEIASKYKVHPNQVSQWKKKFMEQLPNIFERNTAEQQTIKRQEEEIYRLKHSVGQLYDENEFIKKNLKKLNLL